VRQALLVASLLAACAGAACREPPGDAVTDRIRLVAADAPAADAVAAMLREYGGYEAWVTRHAVEYRYTLSVFAGEATPRLVTHQVHHLGLGETVRVELLDIDTDEPQVIRLEGDAINVTQNGAVVEDASQIAFRRTYARTVRWDFMMPWNLLDPGARLESRGVRTPQSTGPVPVGPCDVVRLRFDRVTEGGGTDDWYDLYISRRSHLVEQVHSYRADVNGYRLAVWSDTRAFEGLRVATRRATYASDAGGAAGRLEAVAEYSDVRFDLP
jgi:hypothetical protein